MAKERNELAEYSRRVASENVSSQGGTFYFLIIEFVGVGNFWNLPWMVFLPYAFKFGIISSFAVNSDL